MNSAQHLKTAIVVGSGLAGLSAANQIIAHDIPVLLLERSPKPGGNSIKASSGINGAPTPYQPVPDEQFYADTTKSAGRAMESFTNHRQKLIQALTGQSASAINWLVHEKDVDLSHVAILGGHSVPRTHRGKGNTPPGFAIISALRKSLESSSLFRLRTECTVTKILKHHSRIDGVEFTCKDGSMQKAFGPVVFAAGGFGGDAEGLLAKYRPDLSCFPSTNDPRPGAQPLLTSIGAQLLDMEMVQVHPTGLIDPVHPDLSLKFLAAEVLRGEGGILLHDGKRFVNELDTRENVTNAITALTSTKISPKQWDINLVLDEGTYEAVKSHVDFYIFKRLMEKTTISKLGSSALETIKKYCGSVSGEQKDEFGRTNHSNWNLKEATSESVVYVGRVTPVVHFTMGGVVIDEKARVVDERGEWIEGLWAVGEVTGGIHGANRLGGSSLLECVVFGRVAGDQCAEYIRN
ncbi:Flavocytochrome c [Periconia macrospinosa]|uniref:Fumarate reductase n=1 Tax=Periconia macrospinosa TaxID=97972 RepID=A0A2V1DPX3_9PLEO|nr:Flavocytochrome c [Periconia macrospinosa]